MQEDSLECLNEEISLEEVRAAILLNKDSKSPGIDQIRPSYIKNQGCIEFLHSLFNYCFRTSSVPEAWLKTIIKPIPKLQRASTHPSRGISLQSFVAKAYCRIINNRLRYLLELENILSEEQHEFRPNRSCQDNIFTLTQDLRINTRKNLEVCR